MKKLLIIAFLSVFSSVRADVWTTDYDAAVKEAKKENKPVMLLFTGSDWCRWCIRLENEVLDESEFERYAEKNLICVEADFPRRKKVTAGVKRQNMELQKKYGIRGFPTVLLLNPDNEKILARTGYRKGGPEKYVKHLQALTADYRKKQGPPAPSEDPFKDSRTWVDNKGRKLTGKLEKFDGKNVVIRSLTGKEFKTEFDNLSEEDQKLLQSLPDKSQ